MHVPGVGLGGPSLVGLVLGGVATWTLVYGFAVWFGLDRSGLHGDRVVVVGFAGAGAAGLLAAAAVGLSALVAAVSDVEVSVWLSLWVVAGPLGLLLTLAYHERVGGDPAQWLGLGALAGFAVWPVVEYLSVLVAVTVL